MIGATEWLEQFETTANSVAVKVTDANRPQLKSLVARLDEALKTWEKNVSTSPLDEKELKRRRALVTELQASIRPVMGGGSFVRPDGVLGTGNGQSTILGQRHIMAEQDLILDEIGSGVDRLHQQAININDETTLHKVRRWQLQARIYSFA